MTSILVVDDEIPILNLIAEVLEDNGFTVVTAQDGKQALSLVERDPPNGIITDVMMPHLDGISLCKQVKDNPATHDVVVIVMSASTQLDSLLVGCPADAILPKPFRLDDLVGLVNKHLSPS